MSNELQRAIDTNLASLKVTERDVDRIMSKVRTNPVRQRRKLPAGIAMAMMVMMITVGSVAAVLLSGREIVDEHAIPLAQLVEGESYTVEQTKELIALAQQNGIELSENAKNSIDKFLAQGEGYYKEEMIMAIAKAEFGENPSVWTLEQQKWFGDACVAIGFVDENDAGMPEGGEAAKEPIIAKAIAYVRQYYEADAPLEDPEKYLIGVQYINGDVDGDYAGWYWTVGFDPLYAEGNQYGLTLDLEGNVMNIRVWRGAGMGHTTTEILNGFERVYGSDIHAWTQEQMRAYQAALWLSDEESRSIGTEMILRSTYPDVPEEAISREEAIRLALASMGVEEENVMSVRYLGAAPNPVWKVVFFDSRTSEDAPRGWRCYVEVNSVTGAIISTDRLAVDDYVHAGFMTWPLATKEIIDTLITEQHPFTEASVSSERARSAAVQAIRQRYQVDVDVEALYTSQATKVNRGLDVQWEVTYQSIENNSHGYWVWVNYYGEVVELGLTDPNTLDSIRREHYEESQGVYEEINGYQRLRNALNSCNQQEDPVVQCLMLYQYGPLPDHVSTNKYKSLVCDTLEVAWANLDQGLYITVGEQHVWRIGVDTFTGYYYFDIDADTNELLAYTPCDDPDTPWYASRVLTRDMERFGLTMGQNSIRVHSADIVDTGVLPGQSRWHMLARMQAIYGPCPATWSQSQRNDYRQAMLVSSDYGGLDWGCISQTEYPETPDNAINSDYAATLAAQALGLKEYKLNSAVLLGDKPNPVWKLAIYTPEAPDNSPGYLVEVDCITGEIKSQRPVNPEEEWYMFITLDSTYEYMEENYLVTENG